MSQARLIGPAHLYKQPPSLIYNKSARYKRHECDTSDTNATRLRHKRHEWETSATRMTRMRHECYTKKNASATRVKNFDFGNDKSGNTFSHPYIYYMTNERLQGEEQFHFKNYLLEMPCSYAKMCLKIAPHKLNFVMAKVILKAYILNCSCKCLSTFPHNYA